jgi:hypothetical protein
VRSETSRGTGALQSDYGGADIKKDDLPVRPFAAYSVPLAHSSKDEYGDDGDAGRGNDRADECAEPLRRGAVALALESGERVADQSPARTGDEDGHKGHDPRAGTG